MKSKYILLTILLVGLLIRIPFVVFSYGSPLQIIDEQHYNNIAVHFAQTGNFGVTGHLSSIRPPFYIWTVTGFYKIFGVDTPITVQNAVRIFQVILSLITTYFVYLLGRKAFKDELIALVGAGLFCFYPSIIAQNCMILTETLFIFWLVLAVYFLVCIIAEENNNTIYILTNAVLCGISLGCGALTRSILWLAIPCVFLYLVLFFPKKWLLRLGTAVTVLLVGVSVITPWVIRNTKLQKTLTMVDCMSGRNLMMGNYEYTPMYRAWDAIHMQGEQNWDSVLRKNVEGYDKNTQGQKDKIAGKYAKEFMMAHPGLTFQRFCMKALCFWQLDRSTTGLFNYGYKNKWEIDTKSLAPVIGIVTMSFFVTIFLTALFGVFFASPDSWRVHLILLCVIALFWGVHSIVFAHSRYHLPLVPLLCLYSAAYIVYVIRNGFEFTGKQIPKLAICVVLIGTYIGFWTLETLWYLE